MSRLAVDGLELHYAVHGDGEPVVLLHGFTSSGASWKTIGWVDALVGAGFSAIALDARSHGESEPVYEPSLCRPQVLAADVLALLDHLELPAARFVGFSLGGATALRLAFDHPSRVQRLVVGGVGDAAIDELHDPSDVAAIAAAFAPAARAEDLDERLRGIRRNADAAGRDVAALLPFLQNGGWPGSLDAVRVVEVPLLLFVAERDQYMLPADELVRRLVPADVVVVPGTHHHDVLLDEAIRRRAVEFLSGV